MISKELIEILQKYQEENAITISEINNHIKGITSKLKLIKSNLAQQIALLANDDNVDNNIDELVNDSKVLRNYISSIQVIPLNKESFEYDQISLFDKESPEYDQISLFDKIYVYIIDDNICPECGISVIDHEIQYMYKDISKSVIWHRYPIYNKLFCFDYELEDFNVKDTNISINYTYYMHRKLTFQDAIVLSNLISCTYKEHKLSDVTAEVPVFMEDGSIEFKNINISYCQQCNKYIMLKTDFKNFEGVVACKVIDQTTPQNSSTDDEIEIKQKESILYQYGYNVKTKEGLSGKQRHMILAAVIESNILTRGQICSLLDTLIERGSKIKKWELATQKWKQDREYVKNYNIKNLPRILLEEIILKYSRQTNQ